MGRKNRCIYMSTQYFNFNHEADLTPVEVNDVTGEVTLTLGDQTQTFNDKQEFAEFYATARNVLPENLKNWVLTEDQDQFAFVLRSGTAGLDVDETAKLVQAYRAAGMTPEEIGVAIASQVAQPKTDVEPSQPEFRFADDVLDNVKERVSGLSQTDKRLVKRALLSVGLTDEDTSFVEDEELVKALTTDDFRLLYTELKDEDSMEERLYEIEDDEDFDASEYSFDDVRAYVYEDLGYDDDDYPDEKTPLVFDAVITHAVQDGRDILEDLYPVPAEVGLDLELGHSELTLDERNTNETSFKKAQFLSELANRQKFATVVKHADEHSDDYDVEVVNGAELGFDDVVYEVAKRYYLVSFE